MNNNNERSGDMQAASGRSGPSIALIIVGLLTALIVVFILKNSDETQIDFMFFDWNTTVRWSIFIAVLLGVLLDRVILSWWRRRGRK
jgi:uncharacterized integral membrane protein